MRKLFAMAAAFMFACGAVQAEGVKLTERNPLPPRVYQATSIVDLFENEFEIRVSNGTKPAVQKYRLHDRARHDELLMDWNAEITIVPDGVSITHRASYERPEVGIVLFDRYVNLRVRHENLSFEDNDELKWKSDATVRANVKIDTIALYRLSQNDTNLLIEAVHKGKPLRFRGELYLYNGGDSFDELAKRLSNLTFYLQSVEDPQAKPAESPICKDVVRCPW